jgi:hypothetical protein
MEIRHFYSVFPQRIVNGLILPSQALSGTAVPEALSVPRVFIFFGLTFGAETFERIVLS